MKSDKTKLIVGLLCFSLYIICISCQNEKKAEEKQLNEAIINNLDIDEKINWIVILPGMGCNGCIQEAEMFMKENVNRKEIIFVLTKISSLKILQKKIDIDIHNHPNIFVDKENVFNVTSDNSIYPCLIKLQNGYIVEHEFQSPQNGQVFLKLKSEISL